MGPKNNKKQIEDLAHKYLHGTATDEERKAFDEWFSETNDDDVVIADQDRSNKDVHQELLFSKIQEDIANQIPIKKASLLRFKFVGIAASLMMVGLASWLLFKTPLDHLSWQQLTVHAEDIAPAKNSALLTLASGQQIVLNTLENGAVVALDGVEIQKSKAGLITYKMLPKSVMDGAAKYNTLHTAKGEQFQLILSDGSKVWLNAETTLKFPEHFNHQAQRQVLLSGEAYFEVTHHADQPFIVQGDQQQIEVLGTQFNVSNYKEEKLMKTTLISGSVKINNQVLIKPDQQAISSPSSIQVKNVDVDNFIDWKNGLFSFKNENIVTVMRKIARWYNVEVVFQTSEIADQTFTGNISRSNYISKVLRVLTESSGLRFELKDHKITVLEQ